VTTVLADAISEDLAAAESIQAGLPSGGNRVLTFGRNELGLSYFHEEVESALGGVVTTRAVNATERVVNGPRSSSAARRR
jgi:hypothetical protein